MRAQAMLAVLSTLVLIPAAVAAQERISRPVPDGEQRRGRTSETSAGQAVREVQERGRAARAGRRQSGGFLEHLLQTQKAVWTSPRRLRFADADWLLPLGIAAGGMLATDTDVSQHLSNSPTRLRQSRQLSNLGVISLAGASGGLFVWGKVRQDDRKKEAGLLAGEAMLNSLLVTGMLKTAAGRERPLANSYRGAFGHGGRSFPSEHAALAWAAASVIAHEYPGRLTKLLSYGLASAVSTSQISAKRHFPSDVLVGSAVGWFVGQQIYRAHHSAELGGSPWPSYGESADAETRQTRRNLGSPFVALDSWVYPALERLTALGYVRTGFLGMRPWSRLDCAYLVQELGDRIDSVEKAPEEVNRLYAALSLEFAAELRIFDGNRAFRVESLYTRFTGIEGKPLRDGYHFGQTVINDSGRPFAEGFHNVTGFSGWGAAGRFALYVRGEFQHAPGSPVYSLPVRQAIAAADENPVLPATPIAVANQFLLLDTYVSASLENWQISFGKQSLWWGPGAGGPLLFSHNAEPIYMGRISRAAPFALPWIFRWLGPMKLDVFLGKLSGHAFPPRPLIHGEKISFKPTPNLELGFSRTVVFAGVGRPLTMRRLYRTYFSIGDNPAQDAQDDPGDRRGGFEFSYRVPGLRDWLTVYANSLSDDDPSPLAAPRRAAFSPGIYLPKLPWLPQLDFRAEAVYTDVPAGASSGGKFVYFNGQYHDGYTNKGNLLGSWVGREGQGMQLWSTYWFSPRSTLQWGYRHGKVDPDFIPGGGTLNDVSLRANVWIHPEISILGFFQYEKWAFPVLAPTPQSNVTSSVQVTFWPRHWRIER